MVALALCLVLNAGGVDDEYAVSDRPLETMTRRELKLELLQLEDRRPGLGGPITMVSVGAGLAAYGGLLLLGGSGGGSRLFSGGGFPAGYVFVAMLAVGAGLLVPGVWLWWIRREPRAVMGDRMDAITARLEAMDRGARRRGEPFRAEPEEQLPPPPPTPPGLENYQL
jgi:hypothetical protein